MKLTANQLGMILHGMYMSDYFKTEDLENSLEQLIADEKTIVVVENEELNSILKNETGLKSIDIDKIQILTNTITLVDTFTVQQIDSLLQMKPKLEALKIDVGFIVDSKLFEILQLKKEDLLKIENEV